MVSSTRFSYATFLGGASFPQFTFDSSVRFDHVTFKGDAKFWNCQFNHRADFKDVTNKGEATFEYCTFHGLVEFVHARFEKAARFGSIGDQRKTTFSNSVYFIVTTFGDEAEFANCVFEKNANFVDTVFCLNASFVHAEFLDEAAFNCARFQKKAFFEGIRVEKLVSFRGGPNEPVFLDEGDFQDLRLARRNMITFTDANLSRARFAGANVGLMEFDGVEWCRINRSRLGLYEETFIDNDQSWPFSITDVEQLYRALKQNYEERRDVARAGDFHIGEKEMRRRNPKTPKSLRMLLWLSKVTSNYGESWLRPMGWFVSLLLWTSLLLLVSGLAEHSTNRRLSFWSLSDWGHAMGFVFARAFHLENSVSWFTPTTISNTISLWAGVLGPIFAALAVLGIRNRLKR